MFTEKEISEIGVMLEDKGLTHQEIDAYFEHSGVKGMKWGVRRANAKEARGQKRANRNEKIDIARYNLHKYGLVRPREQVKAYYELDKIELGKKEARKIYKQDMKTIRTQARYADSSKNGKEFIRKIMLGDRNYTLPKSEQAQRDRGRVNTYTIDRIIYEMLMPI